MSLDGRSAFVTGAASGIGRSIAETLASQGARVVVADIDPAGKDVAATIDGGVFVALDVTRKDAVATAVEQVLAEVGPIDTVVNCAGSDVVKPFLDTDEDLWDFLVQLNLMGVFRVTKGFLPGMVERGFGRVVNIASDAGRVGSSGEAVYSGCKGGVIAFTKTLAREVARHGITANSVCPGPTETPPLKKMVADGGEKYIAAMVRGIPLGRLGQPDDIAAAVAFFASDEAGFITGQTLSVSGGMSMV
jgi:2-hydroxycyclohexanecarboxyl-CoA dehydrogenase